MFLCACGLHTRMHAGRLAVAASAPFCKQARLLKVRLQTGRFLPLVSLHQILPISLLQITVHIVWILAATVIDLQPVSCGVL